MTIPLMHSQNKKELSGAGNRSVTLTVTMITVPMENNLSTSSQKQQNYTINFLLFQLAVWLSLGTTVKLHYVEQG